MTEKITKSTCVTIVRFQPTMLFTTSECDVLVPLLQEAASKLEMIMNIPVSVVQTRYGFLSKQEKIVEFKQASNSSIHLTRRDHPFGISKNSNTANKLKIPDPKTVKTMMQAARLLLAILDTCKELRSLGTLEKFLIYVQELVEEQKQNIRTLDKTSVRIRKKVASDTYLNDPDFIAMRESEADLTNRLFEMQKAKFETLCGTTSENSDLKLNCQLEDSSIRREIGNRFSLTLPRFKHQTLPVTKKLFLHHIFLKMNCRVCEKTACHRRGGVC